MKLKLVVLNTGTFALSLHIQNQILGTCFPSKLIRILKTR